MHVVFLSQIKYVLLYLAFLPFPIVLGLLYFKTLIQLWCLIKTYYLVLMKTMISFCNLNNTLVDSLSYVFNLQDPGKPKEEKEVIQEVLNNFHHIVVL